MFKLKTNGHDFLRFGESLSVNDKVVLKFHIGLLPSHRAVILIDVIFPKMNSLVGIIIMVIIINTTQGDVSSRMCGKSPEILADLLSGCSALAQSKYLERHNVALKVFFFEMARELGLIDSFPPWYSPAVPKPICESSEALAFWDVPVYAEHTIVEANRVDARFVDHKTKKVWAVEMSCRWIEHLEKKSEE